jgi:predicted nucleic acid-binding Zn ribbon protein
LPASCPTAWPTRARALLGIQSALERALPAALSGHVRVMQFEGGVLRLACDSGAVASRLRQQTDALIAGLGKLGIAVARYASASTPSCWHATSTRSKKHGLPPAALDELAT